MPSVKIDGTWMEIDTPSVKIGGTWMEMDTGYCKIGGTWHEWDMGPSQIPVTITGTGSSDYCYAIINGTTYTSETSGIEVLPGDAISFRAFANVTTSTANSAKITINGTVVKESTQSSSIAEYTWTVPDGCKSVTIAFAKSGTTMRYAYNITVTTT